MSNTNIFDFADLSDISEAHPKLVAKFQKEENAGIAEWEGVLKAAFDAGAGPLDITKLTIAAVRLGIDVKSSATIRTYLYAAVAKGTAKKPTRQTYAWHEYVEPVKEDDDAEEKTPAPAEELTAVGDPDDVLAGL